MRWPRRSGLAPLKRWDPPIIRLAAGFREAPGHCGHTDGAKAPDTSALLRLPGVNDVVASGDAVTIRSGDADATLPALYALGRPVRGLEVGGGGLEEALIALTSDTSDGGTTAGAGQATAAANSSELTRVG